MIYIFNFKWLWVFLTFGKKNIKCHFDMWKWHKSWQ